MSLVRLGDLPKGSRFECPDLGITGVVRRQGIGSVDVRIYREGTPVERVKIRARSERRPSRKRRSGPPPNRGGDRQGRGRPGRIR